jgi:hypothetical protein
MSALACAGANYAHPAHVGPFDGWKIVDEFDMRRAMPKNCDQLEGAKPLLSGGTGRRTGLKNPFKMHFSTEPS